MEDNSLPEFDNLDDAIKAADQLHNEKLACDPEWTEKTYYHIKTLIEAFAVGIISSDPYFKIYSLPPNFEKVMNIMAELLQKEFNYDTCPQVGLLKMKGVYKRLAMTIPEYVAWNDFGGSQFTSRFDATPTEREFISLDVPPHNAVLHLRMHTRENKAFEERIKKSK